MKKISVLMMSLLLNVAAFAQQSNYDGPAEEYVNYYFKDIEKAKMALEKGDYPTTRVKINQLSKHLSQIKARDKNYSTASMESEIEALKNELAAKEGGPVMQDQHTAQRNEMEIKKELDYLFKDANLQVGHNNLEFAQSRLDDYKARTEKVLALTNTAPADYVRYISRFNLTMDQFYSRNKDLLDDVNNVEEFKPAFFELQLYEAYWDAARRIYPSEAEFSAAHDKIVAYRKSIGSLDDVQEVADQNTADKIKNRRMEAPAMRDAGLEKFVADAFNATFKGDYGTCLKVVLTQSDWTTERHAISGEVLGRHKASQVAYKGADGKCYLLSGVMYIHEEYIGGSFTNRKIIYDGLGGQEMLCEFAQ